MREDRFLTGGIDSDSAPHAIEDGALLNAVNVRTVISKTQNSTDIQFIDGNEEVTAVTSLLPTGTNTLLGKCVDAEDSAAYFFFHNSLGRHKIIKCYADGVASLVFDDVYVTGGLGWTAGMFISCRAANGFLIFTDGTNDVRYLNLSYPYASAAPFAASMISLITEPPHVPLVATRDTDATVSTNIQFVPLQFTYRITTRDNFQSVLAPYSLTCIPVRESQVASSPSFGNVVDLAVDLDQKFPVNWKLVELVVRYPDGNTFEVIKQYSYTVSADNAAILAHNAGTPLTFTWKGESIYAIDEATTSKQYDNVPLTAEQIELAGNRLLLANNTEGYDTNLTLPGYSVTQTTYTTNAPTVLDTPQAYMVNVKVDGELDRYFAVIIRRNSKNYLLPRECSVGVLENPVLGATISRKVVERKWEIPLAIHKNFLFELAEDRDPDLATGNAANATIEDIRYKIVSEANDVTFTPDTAGGGFQSFTLVRGTFDLLDDPDEFGAGSQSRLFAPHSEYKLGIQFYDSALRKSGVLPLSAVTIPSYGIFTNDFTERLNFTINNTVPSAIPSWASYFAITMSKNQKAQRVYNFVSSIIKVATKNAAGDIKYGGNEFLVSPPLDYDIYGIAVPIASLTQYGYGYSFTQGDYMELIGVNAAGAADTPIISAPIREVANGYVIMYYSAATYSDLERIVSSSSDYGEDTGFSWELVSTEFRQDTVMATIYSDVQYDTSLYEVAKFGSITSGAFTKFFDTNNLTTTFYGDMFTQDRTANAGAYTGFGYTPYEILNLSPVNDVGRVTLSDRIGQQSLPTAVRWSNTFIPGTATNGYATFDPLDYKIIEQTAGGINGLVLTTKGIQDGGQMLIICSNGSFTALIDKQQIVGSDQSNAFIASASAVIGSVNPLKGKWGCASPRSIVEFQGNVYWVDWANRDVIEFNAAGANPVSQYKCSRLWRELLSRIVFASDAKKITAGVNPFTSELMISVPAPSPSQKTFLPSTKIQDPLDCYYNDLRTYIYNWQLNKWICSLESGNEFVNVGDEVLGWNGVKVWTEFTGTPGNYNGVQKDGIVTVPFNKGYPAVKAPLSVRCATSRYPDVTWVSADGMIQGQGVAPVTDWQMREGDAMAAVMRDRLSNNASTDPTWDAAGVSGNRLKGKSINVVMIWNGASGSFYCSSVALNSAESSGHK